MSTLLRRSRRLSCVLDAIGNTPAVRLDRIGQSVPGVEIYLKLENLQPIRSFKIRGAANAMSGLSTEELRRGVWTASATQSTRL